VLDRHKRAADEGVVMEEVEENEFTRITTSGTFMKRERAVMWDAAAEELFYKGLRWFGIDFETIAMMFPHRNRRQIKLKFNKEERTNSTKITRALIKERVPIDLEEYQALTGMKYEEVAIIDAEQRKIEEEQEAEQQRHASDVAEATRKKKEAIHSMSATAVGAARLGTDSAKENEVEGGDEAGDGKIGAASKSRKKGAVKKRKKKNLHSTRAGGEEVEVLGTIEQS